MKVSWAAAIDLLLAVIIMKKRDVTELEEIISGRYVSPRHQCSPHEQESIMGTEEREEISRILKHKYLTFSRWSLRSSLPHHPNIKKLPNLSAEAMGSNPSTSISTLMAIPKNKALNLTSNLKQARRKSVSENVKLPRAVKMEDEREGVPTEQQAMKQERRERLKKVSNPMQLIKHYVEKEGYRASSEQKDLLERLVGVQKMVQGLQGSGRQGGLDDMLARVYQVMNLAVDYNELLLLSLLVLLAAEISFYLHDYDRSFYFYNQARIVGSYAHLDTLKVTALLGMGAIAEGLGLYPQAKRLIKKGLQYAWRAQSPDREVQIYDLFGQILHYQGRINESKFYHARFTHNVQEPHHSALRQISAQILADYDACLHSLEHANLDSLFIEYLSLPLTSAIQATSKTTTTFSNYGHKGVSPRKDRQAPDFSAGSFMKVDQQLRSLLETDFEFKIEMADPSGYEGPGLQTRQQFFKPKPKKELDFEHSTAYSKITGTKPPKPDLRPFLKLPQEVQVEQRLSERLNPSWYQIMVQDIKKRRMEKVGDLKERVRNSHMSHHKYPMERKKSSLWTAEKINESFNRTLLDWIDPIN